jgi:hypothetical protein
MGVLQDAEVLRNGWAADRKVASELAHGEWTDVGEPEEDRAAGRMAEGVELRGVTMVRHHLR